MREILFRGKRKDNGEWVEGAYYKQELFYGDKEDAHVIITSKETLINDFDLDFAICIPETVGQYTGLTDKNGKKIFEGDIIKAMMDYGPAGFYERIVPIKWLNDVGYQWQYFDISTIEIIGNIHDNPELLGGNYCG